MVFDRYVMINDAKVVIGQNATTGAWYCKELPSAKESLLDDGFYVIDILNKLNSKEKMSLKKKEKTVG